MATKKQMLATATALGVAPEWDDDAIQVPAPDGCMWVDGGVKHLRADITDASLHVYKGAMAHAYDDLVKRMECGVRAMTARERYECGDE